MKPKHREFMSMFTKLALSLMVASAMFMETLDQKASANDILSALAQSDANEIVYICESFNQEEPDDSNIEEVLEFIEKTDDPVVRPTSYGQG